MLVLESDATFLISNSIPLLSRYLKALTSSSFTDTAVVNCFLPSLKHIPPMLTDLIVTPASTSLTTSVGLVNKNKTVSFA